MIFWFQMLHHIGLIINMATAKAEYSKISLNLQLLLMCGLPSTETETATFIHKNIYIYSSFIRIFKKYHETMCAAFSWGLFSMMWPILLSIY